jgi:hypothetical protein
MVCTDTFNLFPFAFPSTLKITIHVYPVIQRCTDLIKTLTKVNIGKADFLLNSSNIGVTFRLLVQTTASHIRRESSIIAY